MYKIELSKDEILTIQDALYTANTHYYSEVSSQEAEFNDAIRDKLEDILKQALT